MKWLRFFVVSATIAILLLPCTPVLAGEPVVVVAVPYIGGGITNFTAIVISDTQVDLSWTIGDNIANVMVRAKYSEMPMSRTDGYLVYEGSLESTSDTSMNFDETTSLLYYRIWAQNEEDVWLDYEVNTAETEGANMLMIAFVMLCLGLTIGGYTLRRGSLAFAGMAAWMAMGAYCYITAAGEWGIYMGLFWVCIAMIITSGIEGGLLLTKGEEAAEEEVEYTQALDEAFKDMDENISLRRIRRREGR